MPDRRPPSPRPEKREVPWQRGLAPGRGLVKLPRDRRQGPRCALLSLAASSPVPSKEEALREYCGVNLDDLDLSLHIFPEKEKVL